MKYFYCKKNWAQIFFIASKMLGGRRKISLLTLSEFKRINNTLLIPLKLLEILWYSDASWGDRWFSSICLILEAKFGNDPLWRSFKGFDTNVWNTPDRCKNIQSARPSSIENSQRNLGDTLVIKVIFDKNNSLYYISSNFIMTHYKQDHASCIVYETQPAILCAKLTIETLEQDVKYVLS